MLYKKRGYAQKLNSVCLGNAIIKTITIPVALIIAQFLSTIIGQATGGNVNHVVIYSLWMMLLIVISITVQIGVNILIQKYQLHVINEFRINFLKSFLRNPLDRLFVTDYGELTENLNSDMNTFIRRYVEIYPNIISSVCGLLGYLIFLVFRSPIVAVSLLGFAMLQLIPPAIVKKYMQINYDECRDIEAKITNHIVEAVDGIEVIKLYKLKKWWLNKMAGYHKEYLKIGRKTDSLAAVQRMLYKLLDNILKFGTYILMGIYVMLNYCPIDVAIQAIYLSGGFYESVKLFFSMIPEIAVSNNAEKRLDKWGCYDQKENEMSDTSINMNEDSIIIKDIYYSHGKKDVISSLSYQFDSNKNYLLRGNNGSGKTTFVNLLTGLIIQDCGQILISGTDNHNFGKSPQAQLMFYIPQYDPDYSYDVKTLFSMIGKEKQSVLDTIAKQFGLSLEIMNDKLICNLSGGEKKKVYLTIGFALQPQWLVLDEPTNNLDEHGKKVLVELIRERKGIIVISHDSVLAQSVDKVIKMENGRIYDENE